MVGVLCRMATGDDRDQRQSPCCTDCLTHCVVATEEGRADAHPCPIPQCLGGLVAVTECCFHYGNTSGDNMSEGEDGDANGGENDALLPHPDDVQDHEECYNGCEILRRFWDALKSWFGCLIEGQGSALLSLEYFLLILTIGIALTFAHTSSYQGSHSDVPCHRSLRQTHIEGYMSALLFTSMVGFFVCICCQRQIVGQCCQVNPNRPADYLLIGTVIFGLFSTVWFIFRLVAEEHCPHGKSKIELMYSTMEIIFIMTEIYFLSAHSNVRFVDSSLMKMFLMHVVATNFCLWFRITAGEAVDRAKEVPSICNSTAFSQLCININQTAYDTLGNLLHLKFKLLSDDESDSLAALLEGAMHVLYPCVAEFCLSASGILFKMWLFPVENQTNEHCCETCSLRCSLCCCSCVHDEITPETPAPQRRLNKILLSAPLCTGLLGSLSVVCIAMLVFFRHDNQLDLDLSVSFLYDIFQLATTLIALIAAIIGISSFSEHHPDREQQPDVEQQPDEPGQQNQGHAGEHAREVIVETALLMFSLTGLFIAQGLELSASLDKHNMFHQSLHNETCSHMLRTERATGFLAVITGVLQTRFIIGSLNAKSCREGSGGQAGGGHRNRLNSCALHARQLAARVLLICNLTLWLTKTFELSGLYCHPLYYTFYVPWLQLSDIFYPLWIFFHFHSAASCFDIIC